MLVLNEAFTDIVQKCQKRTHSNFWNWFDNPTPLLFLQCLDSSLVFFRKGSLNPYTDVVYSSPLYCWISADNHHHLAESVRAQFSPILSHSCLRIKNLYPAFYAKPSSKNTLGLAQDLSKVCAWFGAKWSLWARPFTKPPLFERNRLAGSGNPTFESYLEGKAL